jgi:hypothetical protein
MATTELVTREVKKKKAKDAVTLAKIRELAKGIEVPASNIAREDVGDTTQQVIQATEEAHHLVSLEAENLLRIADVEASAKAQEDVAAGLGAAAPEAVTGNPVSLHSEDVIVVEFDSTPSTYTQSTSSSSSIDLDNIPLGQLYQTKSPKKTSQKIPFEPMIPSVNERIDNMSEMCNKVCERLPFNHPLQPPMIQPLNMVPAGKNVESSSSQPTTSQTAETFMIDNLVSHYSDELSEVRPNLQKSPQVTTMEVTLETPPHQAPNLQMASSTSPEHVPTPEHVVSEHIVPEQLVPEHVVSFCL